MDGTWREVVRLRFSGSTDGDAHLLLSELPELLSYQRIISEAARALLEALFDPNDERRVTEALRDHDERRVLVRGRVLKEPSGRLVRFVSVDEIQFVDQAEGASPAQSWDRLLKLAEHPVQGLPSDLASHLDDYLYPRERR